MSRPEIKGLKSLKNKKFSVNYSKSIKKASSALCARKNPDLIKKYMFRRRSMVKNPILFSPPGGRSEAGILKKNTPISLNTRSKLHLESVAMEKLSDESNEKVRKKPTIVFCKPCTSSDNNSQEKTSKSKSDEPKNFEESSLTSNAYTISSHTRSASPKLEASLPCNKVGAKKKLFTPTSKKTQSPVELTEQSKQELSKIKNGTLVSLPAEEMVDQGSANQRKGCLRKTFRGSEGLSSLESGSSKVQTRNRGQRTVGYNEDSDNNYLTEILENEDPTKSRQKHESRGNSERSSDNLNKLHRTNCNETFSNCSSHTKCNTPVMLRPKKEALKNLPNGVETRNHGQRTTVYAEDGDDYWEEYFETLESGL